VHELQLVVERDRVSSDGGNGSPLCLPGIEIRGREDNLVADPPTAAFRTSIEVLPALAVSGQLAPGVLPISPCRFRVPPMSMIPRSTLSFVPPTPLISSSLTLFVKVIVALRCGGLFSTNLQLPVQHDPLGGQFKILIVCEAQFAVDRQTVQRRRTDIEDNIHALVDGDNGACGWHLLV
jgi:hypothetical protein